MCSTYAPEAKMGPPRGHMFYLGLYREHMKKIFLSEITGPRSLIFSMCNHLVDLYQVCSNNAPGIKNGPTPGSHILHRLI